MLSIHNKLESIEYTWLTDLASRRYASGKKGHALHVHNNNSKPPHYPPVSHKKRVINNPLKIPQLVFDIMVKPNKTLRRSWASAIALPSLFFLHWWPSLRKNLRTLLLKRYKDPPDDETGKKAARPQHLKKKKKTSWDQKSNLLVGLWGALWVNSYLSWFFKMKYTSGGFNQRVLASWDRVLISYSKLNDKKVKKSQPLVIQVHFSFFFGFRKLTGLHSELRGLLINPTWSLFLGCSLLLVEIKRSQIRDREESR